MAARKPPKSPSPRPADDDRRARQAEALRANLRRRKATTREDPKGRADGRPREGQP